MSKVFLLLLMCLYCFRRSFGELLFARVFVLFFWGSYNLCNLCFISLLENWSSNTIGIPGISTICVSHWPFPRNPLFGIWFFFLMQYSLRKLTLRLTLKFLSLNMKGISNFKKRKTIFTWCRKRKADLNFLQEPHSIMDRERCWRNEWVQILNSYAPMGPQCSWSSNSL